MEKRAAVKDFIVLKSSIEKYYKKIRKSCSSTVSMQFYQIESYILAGIRYQILESVPF